jgi:hypothetical protein
MHNTVQIGDRDYTLELDLRALVLYEQAAGVPFHECQGLLQLSQMLFCVLTASNEDFRMEFEEFLKATKNIQVITQFSEWMTAEWARQKELSPGDKEEPAEGIKKKPRPRKSVTPSSTKEA